MNEQDYTPIQPSVPEDGAMPSPEQQGCPAAQQQQANSTGQPPVQPVAAQETPLQDGSQPAANAAAPQQTNGNGNDLFSDSGAVPVNSEGITPPDATPQAMGGAYPYSAAPAGQSIPSAASPVSPAYDPTAQGPYSAPAGQDAYTYAHPSATTPPNGAGTGNPGMYGSASGQPVYPQAGGYTQNVYSGGNAGQPGYTSGTGSYYPAVPPQKPPKKKSKGLLAFFLILLCVAVAAGGMTVAYYVGRDSAYDPYASSGEVSYAGSIDVQVQEKPASSEGENPDGSMSVKSVVEQLKNSVVSIMVYSPDGSAGSQASGMILSEDGYILTNDHIYKDIPNAKFMITLYNGDEYAASFVAGDSRSDIAILKMENVGGLQPVTFGKSSQCEVGEQVVAIGNSAGLVDTVTVGYISALGRRISSTNGGYTSKYIQTDTAINPGNSGGPLVNLYGQVIGINSSKIAEVDSEGICFAIPSDDALSIVENLLANGRVVGRAKLGITYTEISSVAAEINNCPMGLYIASISEDSDLYGKDIAQGDIITHINGEAITSSNQVLDIIDSAKAGDTISLTIYKSATGSSVTVSTRLVEYVGSSSYNTSTTDSAISMPFYDDGSRQDFLEPNSQVR